MSILSKGRLANMMLDRLSGVSKGADNIKEIALSSLGNIRLFSSQREVNAAWDEMKKKAIKKYPEKFILDDRGVLRWNDGTVKKLDKKITLSNYKKLNALAEKEKISVDKMISKLIKNYKN